MLADDRLGQMESTLLTYFLKASKIKRWLANPENPSVIKDIKSLFDKFHSPGESEKNSAITELMDDDDLSSKFLLASSAPQPVRDLLHNAHNKVRLHARFKRRGIVYAVSDTHKGNSQILYYPKGDTSLKPIVGIITFIYSEMIQSTIQPAVAVRRLTPLDGDSPDPFAKYPHWPAKLYHRESSVYERVQPDWVHGHFARWNISADQMVMVPLNKVSWSQCPFLNHSDISHRTDIYVHSTTLVLYVLAPDVLLI